MHSAVLCELIHASLDAGNVNAAATFAAELSTCNADNAFTRAWAEVSRARVHLALQQYAPAREAAQAAEAVYARIAPSRFLGTALRFKAEALYGQGERYLAFRTIVQAVDALKRVSSPRPLASAYFVMAQISGRRRYADMAQKLLRE